MDVVPVYQMQKLLQDDSTVLDFFDASNSETLSQILAYVYEGGLINILQELYQRGLLNDQNIYSDYYHKLVISNPNIKFDLKIAEQLVVYFGHTSTNKALTDMEIYRNDDAGNLLGVVGGFIPDLAYTLNKLGMNLHDTVFLYLEENDQKYRAELLNEIQELSHDVYRKLYPDINYLIDVILAIVDNKLISAVEFSRNFLRFLLESDIDMEHGKKVMIWVELNKNDTLYQRYATLYPQFVN